MAVKTLDLVTGHTYVYIRHHRMWLARRVDDVELIVNANASSILIELLHVS